MLGTTTVSGVVGEAETEVEERVRLISEVGLWVVGVWKLMKKKGREVRGEGLERMAMVGKERKKRDMADYEES